MCELGRLSQQEVLVDRGDGQAEDTGFKKLLVGATEIGADFSVVMGRVIKVMTMIYNNERRGRFRRDVFLHQVDKMCGPSELEQHESKHKPRYGACMTGHELLMIIDS